MVVLRNFCVFYGKIIQELNSSGRFYEVSVRTRLIFIEENSVFLKVRTFWRGFRGFNGGRQEGERRHFGAWPGSPGLGGSRVRAFFGLLSAAARAACAVVRSGLNDLRFGGVVDLLARDVGRRVLSECLAIGVNDRLVFVLARIHSRFPLEGGISHFGFVRHPNQIA
jgi:hypothetical protein